MDTSINKTKSSYSRPLNMSDLFEDDNDNKNHNNYQRSSDNIPKFQVNYGHTKRIKP
jgi:hypothetical protein